MFSNTSSNSTQKSDIRAKRDNLQQSRAQQERDKIRKSIRFENLSVILFHKNQSDYNFILQANSEQLQSILTEFMKKGDLVSLIYCIAKVEVLNLDFLRQFVQFSQNLIHQPEVIFLYKFLSMSNPQFYEAVFDRIKIIEKIVHEIKTLKSSSSQQVYLEVLEYLAPHFPKRYQSQISVFFDIFCEMLENQSISFEKGLKILKTMSPFINNKRNFSLSTVERIVECYQKQMSEIQSSNSIMTDCFVVLVKIIFYQENTDVITNMRLMRILLHAKENLSAKVVEDYHNIFLLLARLVEKTGQFEVEQITRDEFMKWKWQLTEKYGFEEIMVSAKQNYLTTCIVHKLFEENKNVLTLKEFSLPYLNLILKVVVHCSSEIIVKHFMEMDIFYFLTEAIDCIDMEISVVALEIFLTLLSSEMRNSEILTVLKDYNNLQQILEHKALNTGNTTIYNKITLILERFQQFNNH